MLSSSFHSSGIGKCSSTKIRVRLYHRRPLERPTGSRPAYNLRSYCEFVCSESQSASLEAYFEDEVGLATMDSERLARELTVALD